MQTEGLQWETLGMVLLSDDGAPHLAFELSFLLTEEVSLTQAKADENLRSPNTQELSINI